MPENSCSRLHIDYAINFMGLNWLVITNAYSKYPSFHPTISISTKATILQLEDFSFLILDTLTPLSLTTRFALRGAPYPPACKGAAERLIQSFKQALREFSKPPKKTLPEFFMFYWRIVTTSVCSPSELLNSRQLRTKLDTSQSKLKNFADTERRNTKNQFKVGDPCCAM